MKDDDERFIFGLAEEWQRRDDKDDRAIGLLAALGLFLLLLVVLILVYLGLATWALAAPTDTGQEREPCKHEIPYCCWVDGPSLPGCKEKAHA